MNALRLAALVVALAACRSDRQTHVTLHPPAVTVVAPTSPGDAPPTVSDPPPTSAGSAPSEADAAGAREPLGDTEFARVLAIVEAQTFPSHRVSEIKRLAPRHRFTTRQAIVLATTVPFSQMRVEALGALYPRVVDPEDFDQAFTVLEWEDDRRALRARLGMEI